MKARILPFVYVVTLCVVVYAQSAQAATWLGDKQGIPSGYTGQTYPGQEVCYEFTSGGQYGTPGTISTSYGSANVCNDWASDDGLGVAYNSFFISMFSVNPPNSTAGETQFINTGDATNSSIPFGTGSSGSSPVLTAGNQLQLEWSCLDKRIVYSVYHGTGNVGSSGEYGYNNNGNPILADTGIARSTTGSGSGFTFTSGALTGNETITPPTGTDSYSLTCIGNDNQPAMTVSVKVLCQSTTPTWTTNGNVYVVYPGQSVTINAGGYDMCVTNPTQNNIVVPAGSTTELTSFRSHITNASASYFDQ